MYELLKNRFSFKAISNEMKIDIIADLKINKFRKKERVKEMSRLC